MRMKSLFAALAVFALGATTANAATTFTIPDDNTAIGTFNGFIDGVFSSDLHADLSFDGTFINIGGEINTWTVVFKLTNTSSISSRISVFGFDSNPEILNATSTGVFDFVSSGNLPGVGTIGLCVKDVTGNNCAGGGGGGIESGSYGEFTLVFDLSDSYGSISMNNFAIRYQAIGGIEDDSGHGVLTMIPEPATWIMMIVGFAGMGMALKYRRRREYGALAA